ncbi:MAG: hypothetical protein RR729_16225, partial [Comamonas sp.]
AGWSGTGKLLLERSQLQIEINDGHFEWGVCASVSEKGSRSSYRWQYQMFYIVRYKTSARLNFSGFALACVCPVAS